MTASSPVKPCHKVASVVDMSGTSVIDNAVSDGDGASVVEISVSDMDSEDIGVLAATGGNKVVATEISVVAGSVVVISGSSDILHDVNNITANRFTENLT